MSQAVVNLDPRVVILMDMLREVSRQTDANGAARAFSDRFWQIRETNYYLSLSTRNLPPGQYKITREYAVDPLRGPDREQRDSQNPWRDWGRNPIQSGGFLGRVIAADVPQLLTDLDVRNDPVLGDRIAHLGSCIASPLFDAGEIRNWSFSFRRQPHGFTQEDLEQSVLVSNLVGSISRNLVSVEEIRSLNARLTAQFEEVARVQQSLLPDRHPDIPGVKIATSYLPSDVAGGDYYDFFPLSGGRWGVLIADVSGHGVAAATVMAMLHAILHAYNDLDSGPAAALRFANARLTAAKIESSFVTSVFAVYDPATRRLTFARAGHPQPRLKDGRTGHVRALDGAASLPLGILDDPYEIAEETVVLQPMDTVVFYTDGITESFNPTRTQMFGVEGLDAALEKCTGDPDCVVDTVYTALRAHTGAFLRADDQTLVALRVME